MTPRYDQVLDKEHADELFLAFNEINAMRPQIEKALGADNAKYLSMLVVMEQLRTALLEAGYTPPLAH